MKKHCVAKVLLAVLQKFLEEIIVTIILANLVTNLFLFTFYPFLETKKRESNFQEFGSLVARNISVFCLK